MIRNLLLKATVAREPWERLLLFLIDPGNSPGPPDTDAVEELREKLESRVVPDSLLRIASAADPWRDIRFFVRLLGTAVAPWGSPDASLPEHMDAGDLVLFADPADAPRLARALKEAGAPGSCLGLGLARLWSELCRTGDAEAMDRFVADVANECPEDVAREFAEYCLCQWELFSRQSATSTSLQMLESPGSLALLGRLPGPSPFGMDYLDTVSSLMVFRASVRGHPVWSLDDRRVREFVTTSPIVVDRLLTAALLDGHRRLLDFFDHHGIPECWWETVRPLKLLLSLLGRRDFHLLLVKRPVRRFVEEAIRRFTDNPPKDLRETVVTIVDFAFRHPRQASVHSAAGVIGRYHAVRVLPALLSVEGAHDFVAACGADPGRAATVRPPYGRPILFHDDLCRALSGPITDPVPLAEIADIARALGETVDTAFVGLYARNVVEGIDQST